MNDLILLFTGAFTGFSACHFLNIWIDSEFGCEHDCTAQYNEQKNCLDCGKKLKTK